MEEPWKILLYRTVRGDSPVQEFVNSLEIKAQSKVRDTLNLLRISGTQLGLPHIKKLKGSEL